MHENTLAEQVGLLALQLAVALFAAKLGAEVAERWLRLPAVLGELAAGIVIGPAALGAVPLPGLGEPLFGAHPAGPGVPVSIELYALAQIAAVVLLFLVGLETDLGQFLRYGPRATAVALGGVLLPFVFGDLATVWAGFAPSPLAPQALFMGAILTATSVGITARVLSDLGKLDTPEGVTILAGAVVDDVLGILALAVALSLGVAGAISVGEIALVGARAVGFWLALTAVAIALARPISRFLGGFRSDGASVALALALGLVAAYLAEAFGLALIIGAYSVGLALSTTRLGRAVEPPLRSTAHLLVPVFFVVMGMLVDLRAVGAALGFGLLITLLAAISKLVGCAVPSLLVGFNTRGAIRIGLGMLPRGEVALIVAGVGLAGGIISTDLFGVSVLMTVVTTIVAPVFLAPAFRHGGSGLRRAPPAAARAHRVVVCLDAAAADLLYRQLAARLEQDGFNRVLNVHGAEGLEVGEFRFERGEEYLSLELRPAEDGQRELVVEFETDAWETLIAGAVRDATREVTVRLLGPLQAIGNRRLHGETRRALDQVRDELH